MSTRPSIKSSSNTISTIAPTFLPNEIDNMWSRARGEWSYETMTRTEFIAIPSSSRSKPGPAVTLSTKPKSKISKKDSHAIIDRAVIAEERKKYIKSLDLKDDIDFPYLCSSMLLKVISRL